MPCIAGLQSRIYTVFCPFNLVDIFYFFISSQLTLLAFVYALLAVHQALDSELILRFCTKISLVYFCPIV